MQRDDRAAEAPTRTSPPGYRAAHEDYLRRRDALDVLPGGISAGGMPTRVKCLHVLVAHSLAVGPGVNPLGDEALAMLPDWSRRGPCVDGRPVDRRAEESVMRVAAVDCGTNSIRLLVADVRPAADGQPATLTDVSPADGGRPARRRASTGPAASTREALERTLAALRGYADEARDLGAERVRMVATSATRDAENRADFVAGVREILGVDPEVATGDEEAALSFAGATGDLRGRARVPRALPRRRHRRRLDRVRARRRPAALTPPVRSTSAASG